MGGAESPMKVPAGLCGQPGARGPLHSHGCGSPAEHGACIEAQKHTVSGPTVEGNV